MSISNIDDLIPPPSDEQIIEDLTGIHREDSLFSNEIKKIIEFENTNKKSEKITSSDFDKVKELMIRNQNFKEFLDSIGDQLKSNIIIKEKDIKNQSKDLKQLTDTLKLTT